MDTSIAYFWPIDVTDSLRAIGWQPRGVDNRRFSFHDQDTFYAQAQLALLWCAEIAGSE
jgi:hypothetical protein